MSNEVELPPLPEPAISERLRSYPKATRDWFRADQMYDYARAAVLQERERCAQIVESGMDFGEKSINWRAEEHVIYEALEAVAAAIRKPSP
jgi:mannose/cellobiose epimerase-like protein (N-acyl-D-glucosamine 2-epimerase family)